MQFFGKISSIWDEVSWGSDSFMRSSLYKVQSYTYVRGAFEGIDFQDWYKLDLSQGNYTLYVTTEGLNFSSVFNTSFRVDIVDSFGGLVLSEDALRPDIYTDKIAFTYSGSGNYYLKITSLTISDFNYQAAVYSDGPVVPPPVIEPPVIAPPTSNPPPATGWRLFASNGFKGEVGGSGQVFGTTGAEEISIFDLAGSVVLDASFNRGGDTVHLSGNASSWWVKLSGSSAILSDGDSYVTIPVGTVGMTLSFNDGERTLRYDTAVSTVVVGSQGVGSTYAAITAISEGPAVPLSVQPVGSARLFLAESGLALVGGGVTVFGTSGNEFVAVSYGSVSFDASFNRGGDIILLGDDKADFSARLSGSSAVFDSQNVDAIIPIGTAGMEVRFLDATVSLRYDTSAAGVFLGNQLINGVAAPLTFA